MLNESFLGSSWHSNFYCSSRPAYMRLSYSSMDSVLPRIVLLLLNGRWSLSVVWIACLLIDSYTFPIKYSSFASFLNEFAWVLWWLGFLIIQRRGKINLYICVNDANCFVFVLGLYLKYIYFKFSWKSWNGYCISFMQASEISQLKL